MSRRHPNGPRLAIIGGGPAGLSAARLLREHGIRNVTVYEAQERVGGKSFSIVRQDGVHEMGTCYSTLAHRITNRWMRGLGIGQARLGAQLIDGVDFMDFVRSGSGPGLMHEGARYLALWRRHMHAVRHAPDSPKVRAECAMPIEAWLDRHKFVRIRRFMLRAVTTQGYGFLNQVPTCQVMRWCTPDLIFTGVLNQLRMPEGGWQRFWERISFDLDVRLLEPVLHIERPKGKVVIHTSLGQTEYDHVLITVPVDDLAGLMDMTSAEQFVQQGVTWDRYATTLCSVRGWFTRHRTESFSRALEVGAEPGRMLTARLGVKPTGQMRRSPEHIYLCAQYAGNRSPDELLDMLRADIAGEGAELRHVICQKRWKYFPRYGFDALRNGLISRMRALQGERNTWYSGATFSHESVSNIVGFNARLARRMAARLRRTA